jgi:hypothetical protein
MGKEWAMPTWVFLHAWAAHIPPQQYALQKADILKNVKDICANLPCPMCAQHATAYMSAVQLSALPTVEDFKRMLWHFHNTVNIRIKKPFFRYDGMATYNKLNLSYLYMVFIRHFSTREPNMKMMLDGMHRTAAVHRLKKWFSANLHWKPHQVGPNAKPSPSAGGHPHARDVRI